MSKTTNNAKTFNPLFSVAELTAMKMAEAKKIEKADPTPMILAEIERLKAQIGLLEVMAHYQRVDAGLIPGVTPVIPVPEPPKPVEKAKRAWDWDIPVIGQTKAKTFTAKAESVPTDEFEPAPVKTVKAKAAVKRETKAKTSEERGNFSFKTFFGEHVVKTFAMMRPGQTVTAETYPDPESETHRYNVKYTIQHLGSSVQIQRFAKNPKKAYHIEIPLPKGGLRPEHIPANGYELEKMLKGANQ